MMRAILFELLKRQLLAMAAEAFTTENVQAVFRRLLNALKAWSAKTKNALDDQIVEMLESLAENTQAAERFVELVKQLLNTANGQICCSSEPESEQAQLEKGMAAEFALIWADDATFPF